MSKDNIKNQLLESGLVAVVRAQNIGEAKSIIQSIIDGGFRIIEITYTINEASDLIQYYNQPHFNNIIVGAGTINTLEQAKNAIGSQAKFLVSPGFSHEVFSYCQDHDILYVPGVLTPTEVMNALNRGINFLKLFPGSFGDSKYLKALKGPFPEVEFMPTGGVNIDNLSDWVRAGAVALGIGSDLTHIGVEEDLIAIKNKAIAYVNAYHKAREK